MNSGWRAMAAGALLAITVLLVAGVPVGCGNGGSPTSAIASTATAPTSTWSAGPATKPAVSYPRPPFGGEMEVSSFTLGWEFRPTVDIAVTDLGYVDPAQDGLVHRHRVGIFDAETDRLIASVNVGPKSPLDGFFRRESLETLAVLRAGHPYLAAAVFVDGDEVMDGEPVWAPEVGHSRTSVGKHFVSSTPSKRLVAPHREAVWEGFMAPNFKFRPASAASPTP